MEELPVGKIEFDRSIDFSISRNFDTFTCKKCELEFILFSVMRSDEEGNIIAGPLVNHLYCPICGEK